MAKVKPQEPAGVSLPSRIIIFGTFVIVLLHVWGAFSPSHDNWGFHFFGLYEGPALIGAAILVLLFMLPSAQSTILNILDKLVAACNKIPAAIQLILLSALVIVAGSFLAPKLHLLGDGAILLRSLAGSEWGPNIMQSFNNQPLMYLLFRGALENHFIESPANTYDLYVWIDRAGAVIFLISVFWLFRSQHMPALEKVLLGAFLFFGAGSQFFFGYIENYVLQYVLTVLYTVSGWLFLEKRASAAVPIGCFIVMMGLHLGNLVFLPSTLYLVYIFFRNRNLSNWVLAGTAIFVGVTGLLGMYFLGYLPALLRHFASGSVDFLRPFSVPDGSFPYAMFSLAHLVDWLNINILVAPMGLVVAVALLIALPPGSFRTNRVLQFLVLTTFCGQTFTWVVNSALGDARDWDLFSGFVTPEIVLCVYLFIHTAAQIRPRKYTLAAVTFLSLLHWGAWIGVNADAERHLRRVRMLDSPKYLSPSAELFFDEALANYFFDNGRYADARIYYERFIRIDPHNPRIIANISDVYRKLGEKEKYFGTLKLAVQLNSHDPGVYSNLGVEYAAREDTARAIEFNEKAIAIDPKQDKAHANLGILYAAKKDYQLAMKHFKTAIDLGMQEPVVFRYAAELSSFLGDYQSALAYYNKYLERNPGDQVLVQKRDRVRAIVSGGGAPAPPNK
jgi:hypothetical protein